MLASSAQQHQHCEGNDNYNEVSMDMSLDEAKLPASLAILFPKSHEGGLNHPTAADQLLDANAVLHDDWERYDGLGPIFDENFSLYSKYVHFISVNLFEVIWSIFQ